MLAIQEQEVHQCLWRRRMHPQQEVQLAEAFCGVVLHLHEGLVVQRHGVQLRFASRWHVIECILSCLVILHDILYGRLQVEGFNQCRLLQDAGIAHTSCLQATATFRQGAHAKLGVITHSSFDDLSYVLDSNTVLPTAILAQSNIIGNDRLVATKIQRVCELLEGLVIHLLLPQESSLEYPLILSIWTALIQDASGHLYLVLLIADSRLQQQHLLAKLRILYTSASLVRLIV
mmetsp:Transcript_321/g.894  ORF Transcript_321/g.894 Transcript_321/m.894 type:complete len:232 (+) Transcript_321:1066-1761(+)